MKKTFKVTTTVEVPAYYGISDVHCHACRFKIMRNSMPTCAIWQKELDVMFGDALRLDECNEAEEKAK